MLWCEGMWLCCSAGGRVVQQYQNTLNAFLRTLVATGKVHIVCLPPHSTLTLQLLDVSFLQPLKTNHAHEIQIWLKTHSNSVVTHYQITGLVGESLLKMGHSSYCCKRVPEHRLVSLQHSHNWWTGCWKNLSATSRAVCLKFQCFVPKLQKNRQQ